FSSQLNRAVQCAKPQVHDVSFIFEEIDNNPGELIYTGISAISTHPNLQTTTLNPYNKFAQIIINDTHMREQIIRGEIDGIDFCIFPDGSSSITCSLSKLSEQPTLH